MKSRFLAPVLLLVSACSPPPYVPVYSFPSPARDTAVGCWRLESFPGLLGRPLATTLVRLDTVPLGSEGMRMRLIPDPRRSRGMDRWGVNERGDGVVLRFSNGFSGVVVRAKIRGGQLRGRGRTWTDTPTWVHRGAVRGQRVPCPADTAAVAG